MRRVCVSCDSARIRCRSGPNTQPGPWRIIEQITTAASCLKSHLSCHFFFTKSYTEVATALSTSFRDTFHRLDFTCTPILCCAFKQRSDVQETVLCKILDKLIKELHPLPPNPSAHNNQIEDGRAQIKLDDRVNPSSCQRRALSHVD